MQFRRVETQRRRSGRSFAPECRFWVSSSLWKVHISAGNGHGLPIPSAPGSWRIMPEQGSAARLDPEIVNTDRIRHIANTSHI